MSAPAAAPRDGVDLALIRRIGLAATMALLPLEGGLVLSRAPGVAAGYNRASVLLLADVGLLAVLIAGWRRVSPALRGRRPAMWTAAALAGFAVLAWPFHPTGRGALIVLRLAATGVLAATVATIDRSEFRRFVVVPLLAGMAVQTAVGYAQVLTGSAVGLPRLGERPDTYEFGGVTAAQGTFIHPYVLAGFALVAGTIALVMASRSAGRPSSRWLVGGGVALLPVGVTFGRAAALAALAVLTVLVWGAFRASGAFRAPALTAAAALLVPALVWGSGWVDRAGDTTGDPDSLASGRVTLAAQAVEVAADHPLVGVGPGRYTVALESGYDPQRIDAPHVVPLLVAAEDGIPAGVVTAAMLLLVGVAAVGSGPGAFAVYLSLAPFLALDKFAYLHPNGVVLLGLWLGTLDRLLRDPEAPGTAGPDVTPDSA